MPCVRSVSRATVSLSELRSPLLRSVVRRVRTSLVLLSCITATAVPALAAPDELSWADDEVLVKFRSSAPPSRVQAILAELGARRLRGFRRIGASRERLSRMSVPEAVARFRNDPAVEFIEPNYVVHAVATPNDPRFSEQWALWNLGQTGGLAGADIDARDAWDVTTGSADVLVAIIDTGIDYTHPDLSRNIFANPGEIAANGIDDDGNGFVDDVRGWDFANGDNDPMDDSFHGTHVAGTVGAAAGNGVGVAGVAWDVRLLPLKFLGSGGSGLVSDAVLSIEYATLMGARIMSNSWGGPASEALRLAIQDASDAGILFVAAAGNAGTDNDTSPFYPASYEIPSVISVAASDERDQLATFSCFGATSVDLAAPGVNILSTVPGRDYRLLNGTSMATPHVSGVLALMLARRPDLTVGEAKARLLGGVDRLPSLTGLVASGGRLNAFLALADPDSTPPEPIADLGVTQPLSGGMALEWTSPLDAGVVGRAARYEVYVAPFPFDGSSIGDATPADASPPPLPPGSLQRTEVLGLSFGAPYWFAVLSVDHFGNRSSISNVVAGTTLGAPAAVVEPGALEVSLLTGARASSILTVGNGGAGSLDFEVVAEPTVPDAPADATAAGAGGPDKSGYRWTDSREPGGPPFDWVEIVGIGTPVPIGGDDVTSPPLPIGFAFPFYGVEFTEFRACTNGFLSFTSPSTAHLNSSLPNLAAPENLLAVFWDDLVLGPGSYAYYRSDGARLVVEYSNVTLLNGAGPYTFEVILDRAGGILFQYAAVGGPVNGATLGIQNGAATDGLTVASNTDYVTAGLAVHLAPTPGWLGVSPSRGRVFAPGSASVRIDLDATGLAAGPHGAVLHVRTNDPARPRVDVPLTLTVGGGPDIAVSAFSLDLGGAPQGGATHDSLQVSNRGTEPLLVTGLTVDSPDFAVSPGTLSLAPGESAAVGVTFRPAALGPAAATLTLGSNDPDEPEIQVALSAAGVPPAEMRLTPTSLTAGLTNGRTESHRISISNTGGGALDYAITIRPATGADPPPPPAVLPLVLADPIGDALRCDLTALRGWASGGSLEMELDFAAPIDPSDFGGFLWIDVDQNASTGLRSPFGRPAEDLGAEYELRFFTLPFNLVVLYRTNSPVIAGSFPATVGPTSIRFSLPLYALGGDDGEVDVVGLLGGAVIFSEWFPNTGHGTLGRVPWLSVSPTSGTVPPGGTVTVDAEFHPGPLHPGGYDASVLVTSNDPSAPSRDLPAHLDLTAAPVLVLSDSTVAFGSVYLGGSAADSVAVSNEGADSLRVAAVTADRPEVSVAPASLVLPPGGRRAISLQFTPSSPGPVSAVLTLTHNSGDGVTNVPVTGEGAPPPVLAVQPSSAQFDLKEGERASQGLTIRNDGAGDLVWNLRSSVGPVPSGASELEALNEGGPDRYGYRWDDSDEPGGPEYQWVELRGVGSALPLSGDDVTLPNVPIGFPFPFYGREFSTINVCSNGIASFTSTEAPYSPRLLPSAEAPENLLAPLWIDLSVGPSGAVYAHSDGARFILEYDDVRHAYWPGSVSFQVILYRTGVILFQYRQIEQVPVELAAVGIQDGTKTDGLLAAPFPRPVREQLAIRFAPAPRWLAAAPDSGRVGSSSSVTVPMTADASGVLPGDYEGHLTLRSNDPRRAVVRIPVGLHVVATPPPDIDVAPARIEAAVPEGGKTAKSLILCNTGGSGLTAEITTAELPWHRIEPATALVPAGACDTVGVFLDATGLQAGDYSDTLAVSSNDPDEGHIQRTVLMHVGSVEASAAEIGPGTLNRESRGRFTMAYVELPQELSPSRVLLPGIRLNEVIPVTQTDLILGDFNANGVPDLQLKFDRAAVEAILPEGEAAPMVVTGEVEDTRWFAAHDTVRVIRPRVDSPNGGELLAAGSETRVRWANPAGWPVTGADVFYSLDGGRTWDPVAAGVRGTTVAWTLPQAETDSAEIRVYVSDDQGPLGFDASDAMFRTRFSITGVEAGSRSLPSDYALGESRPNPFNPVTWIPYDLPRPSRVALRVYDAQGRLVRTLVDRSEPAGRYRVPWDGRDDAGRSAASGVYFSRIRAGHFAASRRMLLLK